MTKKIQSDSSLQKEDTENHIANGDKPSESTETLDWSRAFRAFSGLENSADGNSKVENHIENSTSKFVESGVEARPNTTVSEQGPDISVSSQLSNNQDAASKNNRRKSFAVNHSDIQIFNTLKEKLSGAGIFANDSEVFRLCISEVEKLDTKVLIEAYASLEKRKLGRKYNPVTIK